MEKSVQQAIEAAEGSFRYLIADVDPNTTLTGANTTEQNDAETDEIADESVPLAAGDKSGSELEGIDDEAVPLSAGENQKSGIGSAGIAGIIAAAFAPFLLLFKRKKDEEEEENAVN